MRGKAIDELWEAWHIDRQVRDVLDSVVQDDRFVGLIRQRLPGVGTADIRRSLRRANIRVDYPPLFRVFVPPPSPVSTAAEVPVVDAPTAAPVPVRANGLNGDGCNFGDGEPGVGIHRDRPQRTAELFTLGRLKAGDILTIKGRDGSQATVIDGSTVEYRGRRMSYLAWGKAVTGWKAIQIYAWALLPNGRTLGQLRD